MCWHVDFYYQVGCWRTFHPHSGCWGEEETGGWWSSSHEVRSWDYNVAILLSYIIIRALIEMGKTEAQNVMYGGLATLVNITISYDKLQSLLLRILTREIFCQSSAEGLAGVSQCLHRSTDPQIREEHHCAWPVSAAQPGGAACG